MYTEVEKAILKNEINRMIDDEKDFAIINTAEITSDITSTFSPPSICRRTWSVSIRKIIDFK